MLRMLEICSFLDPDLSSKMQVTFLVHLLMHFLYCSEPLLNCCPVCGEILEVSDKLSTLVHLSLCFDEGTGNQVMTGGFLTDKQASYGYELPQCQLYELSHSVVSPILMVILLYVSVEMGD